MRIAALGFQFWFGPAAPVAQPAPAAAQAIAPAPETPCAPPRADAVRGYLIEQGVRAEQVAARGYGEADPVADNATAPGRAQNRRVMMSVLRNPGSLEVKSE